MKKMLFLAASAAFFVSWAWAADVVPNHVQHLQHSVHSLLKSDAAPTHAPGGLAGDNIIMGLSWSPSLIDIANLADYSVQQADIGATVAGLDGAGNVTAPVVGNISGALLTDTLTGAAAATQIGANTQGLAAENARAVASEAQLAPKSNPSFSGTVTAPNINSAGTSTFTGTLAAPNVFSSGTDTAAGSPRIYGPNSSSRKFQFYGINSATGTHAVNWTVGEDSTPQTGTGTAGGNFTFTSYSDSGGGIGVSLALPRSGKTLLTKTPLLTNPEFWNAVADMGYWGQASKSSAAITVNGVLTGGEVSPPKTLVYLGGYSSSVGVDNLATAADFSQFIAAGGGFYAHANYLQAKTTVVNTTDIINNLTYTATPNDTVLASIASNFSGTPPMLETGFSSVASPQLMSDAARKIIQGYVNANGLFPRIALVNFGSLLSTPGANAPYIDATALGQWQAYVDYNRALGVPVVAPIVTPNNTDQPTGWEPLNWDDPAWDNAKKAALYGGGLAMDTPPNYPQYLGSSSASVGGTREQGYVNFVKQQLRWCHDNGITCVDIVSPHTPPAATSTTTQDFLADTQSWVSKITADGDFPAAWAVENYTGTTDANGNPQATVGTETTAGSLGEVALWLINNVAAQNDQPAKTHFWDGLSTDRLRVSGSAEIAGSLVIPFGTPTTSTATCRTGQLEMDATYTYSCIASNTWHRANNGAAW